jgi:hypothetical protein
MLYSGHTKLKKRNVPPSGMVPVGSGLHDMGPIRPWYTEYENPSVPELVFLRQGMLTFNCSGGMFTV